MKIRATLAAVLLAAILVLPGTAAATTGSGTVHLNGIHTTLTTNPATTGVLISNGILPLPVGPATVAPRFGPAACRCATASRSPAAASTPPPWPDSSTTPAACASLTSPTATTSP